ncbi:MAG: Gfo/Idh/MocA family oxidoreductase [Rubellimicrobium sp.]|nr:Gfo/Idh/MocA family oxidoreductase [Rubellimicrobium sp.]
MAVGPEKLRWGILGAASIARGQVAPAIRRSRNGVLEAVASRSGPLAEQFATEIGAVRHHANYEALLDDEAIDAIYVPLPNSLHRDWAIRALEAGKAVLCEKPLALSVTEAAEMFAAAERARRPLMEAFMYRFHPQTRRVLELLSQGAIGAPREVRVHLSVDILTGTDGSNVRFDPTLGGGSILDMGCYSVDIARMLAGREPRLVSGWARRHETYGVDVSAAAILEFDGLVGLVSCSFEANGNGTYSIIGTEGTIEVPRGILPGLGDRPAEGLIIRSDRHGNRVEESIAPADHYQLMVEAFAEAMLAGTSLPRSPEESLGTLRILEDWIRAATSTPGTSLR